MKLTAKRLSAVFTGALAFCALAMPLTGQAQERAKTTTEGHKVIHKKKAQTRTIHHKKRGKTIRVQVEKPRPIVVKMAPQAPIHVEVTPVGPIAGKPYNETAWREFHADWNGQYHYNGGKYYYDQESKYPAVIPNDFTSITAKFGGAAILNDDPNLVFTGDSGEPYPIVQYNLDRSTPEKRLKLKSAFFGRTFFWRDGVRYDRKMVVNDRGERCFQFVKHP